MSYRIDLRRQSVATLLSLSACAGILANAGCNVASSGLNAEGTRLYQQGQHSAAIDRFYQAVRTDPQDADGYYNLGAVYHQLAKIHSNDGYSSQAENFYNQCLDHDPNHGECYRGLAILLTEQKRPDAAFRLLEGWAQRNPLSADAKVELARLHHEFGDEGSEEDYLLAALTAEPTHSRARAALGHLREESGDYAQAIENYNVSLAGNRLQPAVANRMAALQSTVAPDPLAAPPGAPRLVTAPAPIPLPTPTARY